MRSAACLTAWLVVVMALVLPAVAWGQAAPTEEAMTGPALYSESPKPAQQVLEPVPTLSQGPGPVNLPDGGPGVSPEFCQPHDQPPAGASAGTRSCRLLATCLTTRPGRVRAGRWIRSGARAGSIAPLAQARLWARRGQQGWRRLERRQSGHDRRHPRRLGSQSLLGHRNAPGLGRRTVRRTPAGRRLHRPHQGVVLGRQPALLSLG